MFHNLYNSNLGVRRPGKLALNFHDVESLPDRYNKNVGG